MSEGKVRVRVLLFSHVRHALGREQLELELPAGSSARAVEEAVRREAGPVLEGVPLRLAVNRVYVAPETPLADGDELALIPPVQGG